MSIEIVLAILFIHWVADFLFQDVDWADNKSKDMFALTKHVGVYSIIITIGMIPIFWLGIYNFVGSIAVSLLFGIATCFFHWWTDFFSSKIVAKKFAKKEYGTSIPNTGAFTVIGFDQFLHFTQLFLTYQLLT